MEKGQTDLLRSLKTTSGCRFISANRLRRRNKRMAMTIAISSTMVIGLSVLPIVYPVEAGDIRYITLATLIVSLMILVVSLLDYGNNDSGVAEQHHRCGLEIREIMRELRALPDGLGSDQLLAISQKYDRVLQKYGINHEDDDFRRYQLDHGDEYQLTKFEKLWFRTRLLFSEPLSYILPIVLVATLAGLARVLLW